MSANLKDIANRQKIPFFCHFTHISNVPSILKYGLCAVDILKKNNMQYHGNDPLRIDGYTQYNCLSIGFPNDTLFSNFRIRNRSTICDWVIFLIKPSILWQLNSRFCITNSAKAYGKYVGFQPYYFEKFFQDDEFNIPRNCANLFSYMPTDVQAEVLAPLIISPEYFLKCVVADEDVIKCLPPQENFYHCQPMYFGSREEFIQFYSI